MSAAPGPIDAPRGQFAADAVAPPPGPLDVAAIRAMVDTEHGWIDRRIFWDPQIYALEMERIFARCWIFVAHDSQLPEVGDFLTTYIGEDAVIVARARDKQVHVFINSCSHRGNRVCFAETGSARRFTCNFHGWSYALDGSLAGVTAEELYKDNPTFDRSKLGLHKARVETYGGMHFACFDLEAPSLAEYLGDFRWYLDVLLDNDEGGIEFIDGNIKSRLKCNWKFPAENFVGDAYHATWTHSSALQALFGGAPTMKADRSFQVNANGHGWEFGLDFIGNAATLCAPEIVDYLREHEAKFAERLGKMRSRMVGALSSATVFPNLSFLAGHNTFRTWNPKGPAETELQTWIFLNRNAPDSLKEEYRRGVMLTFSPAGVFEMDDGENFEHCTASNAGFVTRRRKLHTGLGLGSEVNHPELKGHVFRNQVNEANHRAYYQRWCDLMTAPPLGGRADAMTATSDMAAPAEAPAMPVGRDLVFEIEQFLYREARLLDEERYDEWLALMAPDIHYWMPGIQARYRADKGEVISATRMAFFDDNLDFLTKRIDRAKQVTAWAEDPPTRHFHMVSNVEVEATSTPNEWVVHSLVFNLRHRNEMEEQTLSARRRDVIRRDGTGVLKLARRLIRLQQTVLQAKNINTFL